MSLREVRQCNSVSEPGPHFDRAQKHHPNHLADASRVLTFANQRKPRPRHAGTSQTETCIYTASVKHER